MTKTELHKLWETRIADYHASGQKVKEWCAAHEVTPRQLCYWRRKFKDHNGVSLASSTRWLPVNLSEQAAVDHDQTLLVKVGQSVVIEVKPDFDPVFLSRVIRVLLASC